MGTLEVINALYRMRFFDLPAHLAPVRSVFPKDDGSVGTQATRPDDATTTTVCFTLPRYEKCVAHQAHPPPELEALVRRLLSDAEPRTTPTTPPTAPPK